MKIIAACLARRRSSGGCAVRRHARPLRPPRPSAPRRHRAATVRLALDWTPNTNHTGFYVARAEGLVRRRPGSTSRSCRTPRATPETLLAAHQAECGISFQDSMTFAVAAGADIVSVDGDPPADRVRDRRPRRRPDRAAARPRRQDLRRLRLPERGADAEGRDPGRRRHGRLRRSPRSTAPRTRRCTTSRPTSRSRSPPGRASRPSSAGSTCATSSSPTTASRSSTRSSSPATGSGSSASRTRRGGSSRRPSSGFELAASRTRTRPPTSSSPRTRACSTRTRSCRARVQRFLVEGGYLARRGRQVRPADARALAGLLGVPVRAGPPRRRRRQAADRAARLRRAVHERLPAVTVAAVTAGGRLWPPIVLVAAVPRRLGALRPRVRASARSCCRRRRASSTSLWEFRERGRSPRDPDDRRDARRVHRLDRGRDRRGGRRWTGSRSSAARSPRC